MSGAPFIANEVAEIRYRGQLYERVRIEPFARRDGTASAVAIWRSICTQCQISFECTTPTVMPRFRPARRCDECRSLSRWTKRRLERERMIEAARWISGHRARFGSLLSRRTIARRFNLKADQVDDAILHANSADCKGD